MKSKSIGSFFLVLTLLVGILAIAPSAFADHQKVDVTMASGSGLDQTCADTNSCFEPYDAIVDVGGEVTWTNTDAQPHTVTSGDLSVDPENVGTIFDSSFMTAGNTFSYKFEEAGTFPYFCQVHPWMTGVVTVQEAMAEEEEEETYVKEMSSDGSVQVEIETSTPKAGEEMSLKIEFTDASGQKIKHVNYAISATQDGVEVLSNSAGHTHTGDDTQTTSSLASANSVDIKVTLKGMGLPDADPATWTGPKGDVVSLQVVPEFGTIAALVLAISIVSIIAVTAKTRVIPKL